MRKHWQLCGADISSCVVSRWALWILKQDNPEIEIQVLLLVIAILKNSIVHLRILCSYSKPRVSRLGRWNRIHALRI